MEYVYDRFRRLVATLRPDGLLEMLLAQHESALHGRAWSALSVPTQVACFSTEPEVVGHLQSLLPELATAGVANRFVIEYVAAQPPSGLRPMSLEVYDHLMALAAQLAGIGTQADLLRHGLADLTVALVPAGRLIIDRKGYTAAMDAYMRSLASGEIARATSDYGRHFGEPTGSESTIPVADIDAAAMAEFGLSLTEAVQFMVQVRERGDELDPVTPKLPRGVFLNEMTDALGWAPGRVERALDLLSLRSLDTFFPPPAPFKPEDVFPWQYNRALSYLRRPLIQRSHGDNADVIWGPRHLYTAVWYLLDLCWTGRLQAHSRTMQQLMSRLTAEQGHAFNDAVADLLEGRAHLLVRRHVDKVGKLRVQATDKSKDDLGDLDVLVVDTRTRRVWVIETKDLAGGRTPRELANELTKLFPQGDKKKRSYIEKHQRRAAWVRAHLTPMFQWIGVEAAVAAADDWEVHPLIVVDRELVTPFLRQPEIPIVAFEAFRKMVGDW